MFSKIRDKFGVFSREGRHTYSIILEFLFQK